MRGKSVLLAGSGAALILSALIVWSVVEREWVVAASAASAMASAVLLIGLDIWRRVCGLRPFVRTELRRSITASNGKRRAMTSDSDQFVAGPTPVAPAVQQADVVGTVRLLQAQYTGRLDRMQTSVEMALAALSEKEDGFASSVEPEPTAPGTEPGPTASLDSDPPSRVEPGST